MNQKKNPQKSRQPLKLLNSLLLGIYSGIVFGAVIIILYALINVSIFFSPYINDFFFGGQIISAHLKEVVGPKSNSTETAAKLMDWIKINVQAPYGQHNYIPEKLPTLYWGIFNVSGKPTFFVKSEKASWVIQTKLGNCGEDSWYFVELMNMSGFRSRAITVPGEDHQFAEYYDEKGSKVVVDPSNDLTITDTLVRGDVRKWSFLQAVDLSGNSEDVTKEFVRNLSSVTINVPNYSFVSKRISVTINSIYLKTMTKMYKQSIPIASYAFNKNNSVTFNFGKKKEYSLTKTLDLYLVSFTKEDDLDLSKNTSINLNPNNIIGFNNIRLTVLGSYFLLTLIAIWLIVWTIRLKRKQRALLGAKDC